MLKTNYNREGENIMKKYIVSLIMICILMTQCINVFAENDIAEAENMTMAGMAADIPNASLAYFADAYEKDYRKNSDFIAYDAYQQLDFEGHGASISKYEQSESKVEFVKNNSIYPAYEGDGVCYVNAEEGDISVWGGPDNEYGPRVGDTISGYFYVKKLSQPTENWRLPKIRLYSTDRGNVENEYFCVTKNYNTESFKDAPLNEWIRIEIESTGKVVEERDTQFNYNITMEAGSCEFLIDNIVFGKYLSLTPYDEYGYLDFESSEPSMWANSLGRIEIVNDNFEYGAHRGTKALYLNNLEKTSDYSIWGGPQAAVVMQPGDLVGGYYYVKNLSYNFYGYVPILPNISIYESDDASRYNLCNTSRKYSLLNMPENEWIRIDLLTTGRLASDNNLSFSIEPERVGNELLIDDVTFGKINQWYRLPDKWGSYSINSNISIEESTITLNQGKAYLIGGDNYVRIFDTKNHTWSAGAQIPYQVSKHKSVCFGNKIYVIGGAGNNASVEKRIQIYDTMTGLWAESVSMPHGVTDFSAVLFNGKIYVIGGIDENNADAVNYLQIYDIASNEWTSGAPMPMNAAQSNAFFHNGFIYVVGGENNSPLNTLQKYNIAENSWTNAPQMLSAVSDAEAVVYQDKIYVFVKDENRFQIFDLKNNQWSYSSINSFTNTSAFNINCFNRQIYMFDENNGYSYAYDVEHDTWFRGKPAAGQLGDISFIYNDSIYIIDSGHVNVYGIDHGSVNIKVRDINGNNLSGVRVSGDLNGVTNDNGTISFDDLIPGEYTVNFEKNSFVTKNNTIIVKSDDRNFNYFVEMSPAPITISGNFKLGVFNTTPITKLTSGFVSGVFNVNNNTDQDSDITVIMSLYKKEGDTLMAVTMQQNTVESADSKEYLLGLNVPDDGNEYYIKVITLDQLEDMNLLTSPIIFE